MTTDNALRPICERIIDAALEAAAPEAAVGRHLRVERGELTAAGRSYSLDRYRRLIVIGGGKAAARMGHGVELVVGDRIHIGRLVVPTTATETGARLRRIALRTGTHPLPSHRSRDATRWMLDPLGPARADDLVLVLLSGGASALLTAPTDDVPVAALRQLTENLLRCGAPIGQINTVRRHLSRIKGGGLVALSAPATLLGLIISDVVGDPMHDIASGPTSSDPSTFADALAVLERHRLLDVTAKEIVSHLRRGAEGRIAETLRSDAAALARVQNQIVASNLTAVRAAMLQAERLELSPSALEQSICGEARDIGRQLAADLQRATDRADPVCLIGGGETTVTVVGSGRGGRNQELALAAALALEGRSEVALAAIATDGVDGPTDAAGAIVDGNTIPRARALGFCPERQLLNNDAYPLLEACGALVRTGPTGTNVNDLVVMLAR